MKIRGIDTEMFFCLVMLQTKAATIKNQDENGWPGTGVVYVAL